MSNIKFPSLKYGLNFRLVDVEDATDILSLRENSAKQGILSVGSATIDQQREWIKNYKIREKNQEEYYFICTCDTYGTVGLVRLYNFSGNSYTSGSWVVKPNIDEFYAFKIDMYAAYIGFEVLKFKTCVIDVRKGNTKVVKYHKKFFKIVRETTTDIYLEMDIAGYEKKKRLFENI